MTAEEIQNLANEIAREEFERKLLAAERRVEVAARAKRKLERQRTYLNKGDGTKERLLEVPCDVWLPALTGIEMPRGRRIVCPLPGHETRSANCRFYEMGFYCFGCGRGGHLFVFAEHLWGIERASSGFPELIRRVAERLL